MHELQLSLGVCRLRNPNISKVPDAAVVACGSISGLTRFRPLTRIAVRCPLDTPHISPSLNVENREKEVGGDARVV